MRVCKMLRHHGIDSMLKAAFGVNLEIYRIPGEWSGPEDTDRFRNLNVRPIEELRAKQQEEFTAVIADDEVTRKMLENVKAIRRVLYLHGSHQSQTDAHKDALNRIFNGWDLIAPTDHKLSSFSSFVKGLNRKIVIPLSLPGMYYRHPVDKRNGKVLVGGNTIHEKIKIYGDPEGHSDDIINRLLLLGPVQCNWTGYNPIIDDKYWLGYVSPLSALNHYSVHAVVSNSTSPGMTQLEMMAVGVPVVMLGEKLGFPKDPDNKAYVVASNPEEYMAHVELFCSNSKLATSTGKAGQRHIMKMFPFELWKKAAVEFVNGR